MADRPHGHSAAGVGEADLGVAAVALHRRGPEAGPGPWQETGPGPPAPKEGGERGGGGEQQGPGRAGGGHSTGRPTIFPRGRRGGRVWLLPGGGEIRPATRNVGFRPAQEHGPNASFRVVRRN